MSTGSLSLSFSPIVMKSWPCFIHLCPLVLHTAVRCCTVMYSCDGGVGNKTSMLPVGGMWLNAATSSREKIGHKY